jgi:hypothetical protein
MLKKFIFSLTAIMALSLVVMAQEGKQGDSKLTGVIIDKACATSKVAKQKDPQAAAAEQPTSCALMESCIKSGLGIYADGKFTEFDSKSVALAKSALEKTKKDKGAKFQVTGKVTGGKLAVTDIKEVE